MYEEYSTIDIDLNDSTQEFLKQKLHDVAIKLCADEASLSLFMESYKENADLSEVANGLGQAILNSEILKSVMEGMKLLGHELTED